MSSEVRPIHLDAETVAAIRDVSFELVAKGDPRAVRLQSVCLLWETANDPLPDRWAETILSRRVDTDERTLVLLPGGGEAA